MNYSHRFFLYAPISACCLLLAAAGIHWWLVISAFSRQLDALNGHEAMPGVTLHFSSKQVYGFPFRADAILSNFEIDIDAPRGPLVWKTSQFAMHSLTYGRAKKIFEAAGQQSIAWTDSDGKRRSVSFLPARLRASSESDKRGLVRFDVDMIGAGGPGFTLGRVQFHLRRNPSQPVLDFIASLERLKLDHATRFGDALNSVSLSGMLGPIKPLEGLLKGEMRWQDGADDWRTAHGQLLVQSGELRWNKTDMIVKGALSLDGGKRPAGDFSVSVNGVPLPQPLGANPLY
jgi:hypothetical protein